MSKVNWTFTSNASSVESWLNSSIQNALSQVGSYVEGEAKLRTPVGQYDDGRVGGNLRNSITHSTGDKEVVIGTDVHYSVYVEKGTSKMSAQPYLSPAAEENISGIESIFKKNLGGK